MPGFSLSNFTPLSLHELEDRAALQHRVDTKYLIPQRQLAAIFALCEKEYSILTIKNTSVFNYSTAYYDTADWQLFRQHHQGKGNRVKVRKRVYESTQESFIEVKQKTNKGKTKKHRLPVDSLSAAAAFVLEHAQLPIACLRESLEVRYSRITLVHREKAEKLTIDFNLMVQADGRQISFDSVAIAEVKTEQGKAIFFSQLMKKIGIRATSISKYCMGAIALNPALKHNNFKSIYRTFTTLNQAS